MNPILSLAQFVKSARKQQGLNQKQFAEMARVGLRFLRDLEQGKKTLRIDKVNQVLRMFGHELGPMRMK